MTSGPNKLFWKHFKVIVNNKSYFKSFINIVNVYIDLGHWLLYFKMLISPKFNKASYDIPKIFRLIILLNMPHWKSHWQKNPVLVNLQEYNSLFVKIVDDGLHFYFLFSLYFIFIFLFLEQLRLGFISYTITSVTSWWQSHKTDHETWENRVKGSRIKVTSYNMDNTYWPHVIYIVIRVGCTAMSTDHK